MENSPPDLTTEGCRARQQRLREALVGMQADRAILAASENVQWLTGFRPHPLMRAIAILEVDGGCTLIAPNQEPRHHAADIVTTYEAQWLCTLRQDQLQAAAKQIPASDQITAGEFGTSGLLVSQGSNGRLVPIDSTLLRLRRKKDTDELAMMRHAIACTDAMYQAARTIIRPGITELDVYNRLHSVAVDVAGEPLTALGNDYQCNSPGGPPRLRKLQSGELMILDLGPAYRGYHADNCRTFAVDGQPSPEQLKARESILSVFDLVDDFVKPGASCSALYDQSKALLDGYSSGAFFHHLGHGVGLYPHEAPHLNPNWDDQFEVGDVFTVEPGLYGETLRAGIRIEENYLVTATGIEKLTSTPTEL